MPTFKKLLRALLWSAIGLIALTFFVGVYISPSDSERQATKHLEATQSKTEAEASKERIKERLRAELAKNREAIVSETRGRIEKGDFLGAQQYVERFLEFNDPELTKLADSAKERHALVERDREARESSIQAAAVKSMSKRTDKIENIDWYQDRSSPTYNNRNAFFVYIGKKNNSSPWLRIRVQYHASEWLFIQGFIVIADGKRFERGPLPFERDNDSRIWEWYDANVDETDINLLNAVADAKQATIRLKGRQYDNDRTITASEKSAIRNVLNAYKGLGGG